MLAPAGKVNSMPLLKRQPARLTLVAALLKSSMYSNCTGSGPIAGWRGWYMISLITTDWAKAVDTNDAARAARKLVRANNFIMIRDRPKLRTGPGATQPPGYV